MDKNTIKELIYLVTVRIPAILYGKYIAKNLVRVHWGRGLHNFGDCLQPATLRYYGLTPVYVTSLDKSDIVMAGSILQWLSPDYTGYIIGTGGDRMSYSFPQAKVVGVRGKLTQQLLSPRGGVTDCLIGDCGVLMRLVYPKNVRKKKYKVGIMPHFVDLNNQAVRQIKEINKGELTVISPLGNPNKIIGKIKECEHIISSSLHGLIIADAFGIPSRRWVDRETMPDVDFFDFKFRDYYSSIDIEENPISLSGDETIGDLIAVTSMKPQDKINRLITDLDAAMREVAQRFKSQ